MSLGLVRYYQVKKLCFESYDILRFRKNISVLEDSELNETMLSESYESRHNFHLGMIKMYQDLGKSY